jgi:hypothetical protein
VKIAARVICRGLWRLRGTESKARNYSSIFQKPISIGAALPRSNL